MLNSLPITDLLFNPIILASIFVIVIVILLGVWGGYYLKRKRSRQGGQDLDEAQRKGYEILNQSIKKAQAILANAELEGIRVEAGSRVATNQLDAEYSKHLSKSLNLSQNTIAEATNEAKQTISLATQQFINFLNELGAGTKKIESDSQALTSQRINNLFEGFETRLSDFLIKTEQASTHSIELELRSTRQLIETYKSQQMALIDENIIAMMEQTLSLVLGKKLSLSDQLDLIYEALEKAKVEKFIV